MTQLCHLCSPQHYFDIDCGEGAESYLGCPEAEVFVLQCSLQMANVEVAHEACEEAP